MGENKGIYIEELKDYVHDDYEYCEYVAEVIDTYCITLAEEEGMLRLVPEDEWEWDQKWTPQSSEWTHKAQTLIEAEISYWQRVGEKYFPDGTIDIYQHLNQYREL